MQAQFNHHSVAMNRYFSSQPVFDQKTATIDLENGIIHGITVARAGLAKGHNVKLDRKFLQQIVDQANSRPQGVKARFGHPNACSTALGTYLGRFKNYSYHQIPGSDFVKADLHLDSTAKKAPSGNLFDYVLEMAEKNPDMFGASIAFQSDQFEELEEVQDGKPVKEKYFRLKELHATDIVDSPAATDGLFSAESMPSQATQFLDENPELAEFIYSKPERVIEFLNNYLNSTNMSFPDQIKSKFRQLFNLESDLKNLPDVPVIETPPASEHADPAGLESAEAVADPIEAEPVPTAAELVETEPVEALLHSLFTRFNSITEIPGITLSGNAFTQKAEDGSAVELSSDAVIEAIATAYSNTDASLKEAQNQIQQLQDQLAARPTFPKNVTDPQVKVDINTPDPDDTGRQILSNIPQDLKLKLKRKP